MFAVGKPISQRPNKVRNWGTFGQSELDTVVSALGKSKGCIATFIERKTRLYTAIHMPNRTAVSMEIAFGVAATQYPAHAAQTATADCGKELNYLSIISILVSKCLIFDTAIPYLL